MGKKKVLIVDDDPSYAKLVRGWLREDYEVFVLVKGKQVAGFLSKHNVDLILLDYEMPEMKGTEVFEILRKEEAFREIPVMFLTGTNSREVLAQIESLHAAGYITKNKTMAELNQKLADFFSSQNEGRG